jgi:YVTN family beta-propeller protein
VIKTSTNTVVRTISLANPPAQIAITPEGTRAYVTSPPGNSVYLIDTITNTVIGTVTVPSAQGVQVTPDGTRVYVTESCLTPSCFTSSGAVAVIDTVSNAVVATITTPPRPFDLRFTPDGSKAFVVGNACLGSVVVIDTNPSSATYNTVLATIPAGCFPAGVGITPDGNFAYVANGVSGNVLVVDTSTYSIVATISLPRGAGFIAVGSSRAYVPIFSDTSVAVINTENNTVIATVPVGTNPTGAAISRGCKRSHRQPRVYVTNSGSNTVSVISERSNTVVDTVTDGNNPFYVAIARPHGCD